MVATTTAGGAGLGAVVDDGEGAMVAAVDVVVACSAGAVVGAEAIVSAAPDPQAVTAIDAVSSQTRGRPGREDRPIRG